MTQCTAWLFRLFFGLSRATGRGDCKNGLVPSLLNPEKIATVPCSANWRNEDLGTMSETPSIVVNLAWEKLAFIALCHTHYVYCSEGLSLFLVWHTDKK